MSVSRRLAGAAVAALAAAVLLPTAATAAPDGALKGLLLDGECDSGFKSVYVAPRAPYLFAPMPILGADFARTGQSLFPHTVLLVSGEEEGLKARHHSPGETYARSGPPPKDMVTCDLRGDSKETGPFEVHITGTVRGQ